MLTFSSICDFFAHWSLVVFISEKCEAAVKEILGKVEGKKEADKFMPILNGSE